LLVIATAIGAGPFHGGGLRGQRSKTFFFEKKNQKTFTYQGIWRAWPILHTKV
jgi:hypothetical protein